MTADGASGVNQPFDPKALPVPSGPPRCPVCGALTPTGESGRPAQWCSQCHTPLHVAPAGELRPVAAVQPGAETPTPILTPIPTPETAGQLDEGWVDQMLIELKATDDDPWVGRSSRFSGRTQKVLLGVAVGAGIILVLLIGAAIVGRLVG